MILNSTTGAGPEGVGHDCMEAGGRATQGAVAEEVRSNPGAPAIFINHY